MKKILLLFILLVFIPFSSAALTDNLHVYYTLNESGTLQESVRGLNPTETGSIIKNVKGKINNSIRLEGGYLDLGFSPKITDVTVVAWLNRTSTSDGYLLQSDGGGYDFDIFISANGTIGYTNGSGSITSNASLTNGVFNFFSITMNLTESNVYIDGVRIYRGNGGVQTSATGNNFRLGAHSSSGLTNLNSTIDEFGFWNRSLTESEISSLYNSGNGAIYNGTNFIFASGSQNNAPEVTLLYPSNTQVFSVQNISFNASLTTNGVFNLTNATLYIYYSNESITKINKTYLGYSNFSFFQYNLTVGEYQWNVQACASNATNGNCSFASSNYTFIVGASIVNSSYEQNVSETDYKNFNVTIDLVSNASIILAQLVYDGRNYTVSNITSNGLRYTLIRWIDIPLATGNSELKTFFWRFTFSNSVSAVQTTPIQTQNVTIINFTDCSGSITTSYMNFTTREETNQTLINATLQSNYRFWLGSGTIKKNYTTSDTAENKHYFRFCASPNYRTFFVDGENLFDNTNYNPRYWHISNATLTNSTAENTVYLISDALGTKFFFDVREATSTLTDVLVFLQKKLVNTGQYVTVGISKTDSAGKFVEYLEQDKDYQYILIRNGEVLSTIKKSAICAATPCEQTLYVSESGNQFYNAFNSAFAGNVVYTLTFDRPTRIVTYTFLDTTGLAQYFRLTVDKTLSNATGSILVCDVTSSTVSGTLTCNLTGYSGDFNIRAWVSRSPETLVNFLSTTLDEIVETLGLYGVLLSIILILVVVFSGLWNPAVALMLMPFMLISLKLMHFMELSYSTLAGLTLICLIIAWQVKT